MAKTYFAEDGSYGDAENLVLLDTSNWTDKDWHEIEWSSDWERPIVAQTISGEKSTND